MVVEAHPHAYDDLRRIAHEPGVTRLVAGPAHLETGRESREIEIVYQPRSFYWGAGFSATTVLLLATAIFALRRRDSEPR